MNDIPKYVEKMLQKRAKLAMKLLTVSSEVDEYCKAIGVDIEDNEKWSVNGDVKIFFEPEDAIDDTRAAILEALNRKK